MIQLVDVSQLLTILNDASRQLSFIIGEPVELQITKPSIQGLGTIDKMAKSIEAEMLKISITQLVCDQYMISAGQLRSKSRSGVLPDAKKMTAYLLSKYVDGIKDAEIAQILNFDRSSANYNRKNAADMLKTDKAFGFHYQQILIRLKNIITSHDQN